jgi:hypothetical protein
MSYLVDTNILLRLVQKNSPMHFDTHRAIAEFWNCLAYCRYHLYDQAIYEKLEDITKK